MKSLILVGVSEHKWLKVSVDIGVIILRRLNIQAFAIAVFAKHIMFFHHQLRGHALLCR